MDSGDLCAHLRAGDEQAFRDLVRGHHAAMIRFAHGFVRTRASAEDVVQETWLVVVEGLHRFEARSSLLTWIYGILANKARTRGAREARAAPLPEPSLERADARIPEADRFDASGHWREPPGPWTSLDPERIVAGRQLWRHVLDILDTLPAMHRAVLTLHDVEGLEAAAICDILGLSEGNRRVLLHRARARVRLALEQLVATDGPWPPARPAAPPGTWRAERAASSPCARR